MNANDKTESSGVAFLKPENILEGEIIGPWR
jgi:hypothetical protein